MNFKLVKFKINWVKFNFVFNFENYKNMKFKISLVIDRSFQNF